jgi:transcriptional regulator with XRE-family HTH domain
MKKNFRKNRSREVESGVVRYVEHSMNIAKQIMLILEKRGTNQSFLANKLGKSESEISKWLQGTHNFTLKTISKIEDVLNESIIICPKDFSVIEKHFWVISSTQLISLKDKPDDNVKNLKNITGLVEAGKFNFDEECLYLNQ